MLTIKVKSLIIKLIQLINNKNLIFMKAYRFLFGLAIASTLLIGCSDEVIDEIYTDGPQKAPGPKITAQSIMIDIQGGGDFRLWNEQTWEFEQERAESYFWITEIYGIIPQDIKDQARAKVARDNRCNFWNGNMLVGETFENIDGPVSEHYQFTVVPYPDPLDPRTSWEMYGLEGIESLELTFNIKIACETMFYKPSTNKVNYSFPLTENEVSKIEQLQVQIDDQIFTPSHVINISNPNFYFSANVEPFGAYFQYLINGKTMAQIMNLSTMGDKNPYGTTHVGIVEPISIYLGEGTHTITVTGIINDNNGKASKSFIGTTETTILGHGQECL